MDTTESVDMETILNVQQRLAQLSAWHTEWARENVTLDDWLNQLDPRKHVDAQRATQIVRLQQRLRLRLVREPLEIAPEAIKAVGYNNLREHLNAQFARLTKEDRLGWLQNFLFIMTPELRQLRDKIANVRAHRAFGQQRNFLLGAASGMGKTTFLDWYTSLYIPTVEATRNHAPVVKIDAPVSNHTPKPLFQRIILECGLAYLKGDNEEDLLMKLALCFQHCGTELLIIDEIEHITRPEIRRRLLEISNLTRGIPIICASCHPRNWVEGDPEVAGRWNDYFELHQYTGARLRALLSLIELLLPFSQPSHLMNEPAQLIERWTGGVLRDIMILVMDACKRAIARDLPHLSATLLQETWDNIQTSQVTDFLAGLNQGNGYTP